MERWRWQRQAETTAPGSPEVEGVLRAGSKKLRIGRLGADERADGALVGGAIVGGLWSDELGPAWMPRARTEFLRRVDAVGAGSKGEMWLWPRAGGAIGDAPSVLSFVRARPRWKFVLNPVGMMVPELLGRMEDHLRRLFDALGSSEQLGAVVLTSCEVVGDRLEERPLGANPAFDRELLRWWGLLVPEGRPVVLLEGDAWEG